MNELRLGNYNRLKIVKQVDFGLYLDGGDEGEILLPNRYVPETFEIGQELEVFLYLDQDERLIATTEHPLAKVGDFAYLECTWVNEYGAFLSWGLMKDLFCPFREQKMRMEKGKSYLVFVYIDRDSYRIVASAKIDRYLDKSKPEYQQGAEVDVLVWQKTDLGFKVIVDNLFPGLVYENQVFKLIHSGDRLKGYVNNVRPDGKLDIILQQTGRKETVEFADQLLTYLQEHNGYCDLGDKSDAEDIKYRFQVSKKTYKKAIGDLYRRRLITIEEGGIRLV
uniref:S1-like domain-containing RNA-binding protein n=1 Tax=Prevotella sp. GTC17254 TaxID=3236794 RepID=A0AB33J2M8_9BACT